MKTLVEVWLEDSYAAPQWREWAVTVVRCRHVLVDEQAACLVCATVSVWERKG